MTDGAASAVVYVSWGGTGRGDAFRHAYDHAADRDRSILYLAILDHPTFADLDTNLHALVKQELQWLLDAQVRLIDRDDRSTQVSTSVVVRYGSVVDQVAEVVQATGSDQVLIGAPVPLVEHGSRAELLEELRRRTGAAVDVVG